jgi:hypothetical protein
MEKGGLSRHVGQPVAQIITSPAKEEQWIRVPMYGRRFIILKKLIKENGDSALSSEYAGK